LLKLAGGQASLSFPLWRALAPDVVSTARALGVGQDPFTLGGSDLTGLGAVLRRRAHHGQPPPPEQVSLTPVEQAGALATLADAGVYHAPHVIAHLEQGGTAIPLRVARHRVLSPGQAVAVDGALSGGDPVFESAASGTIGATLAVPGNFGSGAGAPYWFSEAGPDYSMSVGLFGGSQAGALLPTAIGKTFQAQAAGQGGLPPVAVPGW
jgi:membrane peptidoglycan carboxypeptidase